MEAPYQELFLLKNTTINGLRYFILDNKLTENDTILMHPTDFETINQEHYKTYNIKLPHFLFLLKVLIRIDNDIQTKGRVSVIMDDTSLIMGECIEQQKEEETKVVYRCHYCGTILDSEGEELEKEVYSKDKDYLDRFGSLAKTENVTGFCCDPYYKNIERNQLPDFVSFHGIDYSVIADIPLMELTEEDFKKVRIDMMANPEYEVLYHCLNDYFGKLFLTPNDNSYSVRGYYLKEREEIFTTADLIDVLEDWRRNKVVPVRR